MARYYGRKWYPDPRTTNDYVKLMPALRLTEYQVVLRHYPSLPPVMPFAGWDASAPTQSLKWYDDYNASKHDRVKSFNRATLYSAYQAVAAAWVLAAAQYGSSGMKEFDDLDNYFRFDSLPVWRYSDAHIYPYDGAPTQAFNYPF